MGEHKFKLNMALQSILGSVKTKPFWDWGGKGGMLPDLTCDPCFKTSESMFFHPLTLKIQYETLNPHLLFIPVQLMRYIS